MSRSRKKVPAGRSGRYGVADKADRNVKVRNTPLDADPLVRYKRGGDQEGDWGSTDRWRGAQRYGTVRK